MENLRREKHFKCSENIRKYFSHLYVESLSFHWLMSITGHKNFPTIICACRRMPAKRLVTPRWCWRRPASSPSVVSKCGHVVLSGGTSPRYTPCTGAPIRETWCPPPKMASSSSGIVTLPTRCTRSRCAPHGWWLVPTPLQAVMWHAEASTTFAPFTAWRHAKVTSGWAGSCRDTRDIFHAVGFWMITKL